MKLLLTNCFISASYENDPDLFNFDYKEDLMILARERQRVFSLSKFSSQSTLDDPDEENKDKVTYSNVFSRIYGEASVSPRRTGKNGATAVDSSDAEYVEPERTSYPVQAGVANNFKDFARPPKRMTGDMDFEMEFS